MASLLRPEDLPNYQHPDYVAIAPILDLLLDCYNGLEGVKNRYLLKERKEPPTAYTARVERAVFNNKLRPVVESNAGLLTAFELADEPKTVTAANENIDNKGSSLKAFFQDADTLALRDNYCYVLVDYPPNDPNIQTEADRQSAGRRPYLTIIDRRNVLNWRYHYEGGACVIDSVVFQMVEELPNGEFGTTVDTLYHQLRRNSKGEVEHLVWRIVQDSTTGGEVKAELAQKPETLSVLQIPLVCYPTTSKPFNIENPPFTKLCRLNIKLFRKESELDEIQHIVNCPTVYREHPTIDVPTNPTPIVFGSNYVIEMPQGGKVGVLEVSGSGISKLEESIKNLAETIDNEGMAFVSGARVQRTATEAYMSSIQVQASLNGIAREKSSAIIRIFDFWCEYSGEKNNTKVNMDHNLLEQPLNSQDVTALMGLWQAGGISHETLLNLLISGRQLPPDFDIEEELERVEAEAQKQAAAMPADDGTGNGDQSDGKQEGAIAPDQQPQDTPEQDAAPTKDGQPVTKEPKTSTSEPAPARAIAPSDKTAPTPTAKSNQTPDAEFLANSKDDRGNYPGGLSESQLLALRDAIAEVFFDPIDAIHDVSYEDDGTLIVSFESNGDLYQAEAIDDKITVEKIGSVE